MDFEKICRLCCKSKCRLYPIDTSNGSLAQLFSDILRIQISADDGLPQQICKHCLSTLTKMQEAIETFRDNDRMLRQQQCEDIVNVDIKEEIFDTEEIEQAPSHELQVTIIEEEGIVQVLEGDQEIDEPQPDDETGDEEWLQSEHENQSDDNFDGQQEAKKPRREKQVEKSDFEAQSIPTKRKCGRRRTRFDDPNRPRLNDFKCYICKSGSMGTPEALLVHLDSHLNELPYTCSDCVLETVVINKVSTLNIHKRMHENPHKCPHCDRRYQDKKGIDLHVQIYHLGENAPCPSPCEQCGKVCSSKSSLKQHLKLHTNGATCEICGKVFIENHKLRLHIERKHEKIKKFECHLCQKKLASLASVQVHIKTMHSTQEVKCEYCDKSYPSEISLRYHLKKHERDPNGKFSSVWKDNYTLLDAEEGTKPGDRLKKCNLCGLVVKYISHHMRTVHFPKEYRCDLCDAVYKSKYLFQTHVQEHEHGKAIQCPICGKGCSEKKNLIAHLKTKKHRDHPLAKSLDWLGVKRASGTGVRVQKNDSDSEQSVYRTKTITGDSD
ncbi:zinc finger protein 37-like [Topomyia yanbarensis]|uniref:zinc finger protein 37-like n=1 Tax=Topomyia yanbarensis TaxID=2498891 RepID=UPI00273BC89E|nr:zinc finger protein 37-like [Topomyia yanbarensis]